MGPGVTPILFWTAPSLPTFDATLESEQPLMEALSTDEIAELLA